MSLDDELQALTAPVSCRRCGTPFPEHGDAGGPVRVVAGGWSSPAAAIAVTCPGFLWVDPGGPPAGAYRDPPASAASR